MSDLHKIQVTGRLGKDPERHDTQNFQEAKSSLGVNNSFKDADGQWKSATTWYPLAFYNHHAEKAMKLAKGAKVFVDGKLSVKTFVKDGKEINYTKIVVNDFFVCGDNKSTSKAAPTQTSNPEADFDDDIPF